MKRRNKLALGLALLLLVQILLSGSSVDPDFAKRQENFFDSLLPGNAAKYHLDKVEPLESSPLQGKRLLFLGSSVTYGAGGMGVSMADYIGVRDKCQVVKEAVSGTTLADTSSSSYLSRLKKNVNTAQHFDAAVVQLSTNDASQGADIGEISSSKNPAEFKTQSTLGSLETIISYIQEEWNCPILVYTNPKFSSSTYGEMVSKLPALQKKWGIEILDLWNDSEANSLSLSKKVLYMRDPIHPTQAGYLKLWTPKFEEKLYGMV